MNSVTLTGRVGKDPEIKSFHNDNGERRTATLTLATKRRTGRRQHEEVSTDWHRIVVTDSALVTSYIEPYIRKGAMISVTGELTYETFDGREGKGVKLTQIIVSDPRGVQIEIMERQKPMGLPATSSDEENQSEGEISDKNPDQPQF